MTNIRARCWTEQGSRQNQEDRFYYSPMQGLFAVADGLGGHDDGERAAQTAIDVLTICDRLPSEEAMRNVFVEVHARVMDLGKCRITKTKEHKFSCGCRPPGTTFSALWLSGSTAIVGHVGDTRIWHIRGNSAAMRTVDHKSDWGSLSKALGLACGDDPDVSTLATTPGDVFVIVSDGVALAGEDLTLIVRGSGWDGIAERIVSMGQRRYAERWPTDNATAVVVEIL